MGIVRTVIWVVLTAVLVVFSMANWTRVDVTIWPGELLNTPLPMLILISFLIGFVPTWLALRAARWSLGRRLDYSERQLADLRALANRPAEPAPPAAPGPRPVDDIPPSPLSST